VGSTSGAVPWVVVVPFAASGVIHLVRPQTFEPIIPTPLRRWALRGRS